MTYQLISHQTKIWLINLYNIKRRYDLSTHIMWNKDMTYQLISCEIKGRCSPIRIWLVNSYEFEAEYDLSTHIISNNKYDLSTHIISNEDMTYQLISCEIKIWLINSYQTKIWLNNSYHIKHRHDLSTLQFCLPYIWTHHVGHIYKASISFRKCLCLCSHRSSPIWLYLFESPNWNFG